MSLGLCASGIWVAGLLGSWVAGYLAAGILASSFLCPTWPTDECVCQLGLPFVISLSSCRFGLLCVGGCTLPCRLSLFYLSVPLAFSPFQIIKGIPISLFFFGGTANRLSWHLAKIKGQLFWIYFSFHSLHTSLAFVFLCGPFNYSNLFVGTMCVFLPSPWHINRRQSGSESGRECVRGRGSCCL